MSKAEWHQLNRRSNSESAFRLAGEAVISGRMRKEREDSPPPRKFQFFGEHMTGREVVIHEGNSTLSNTGYRLWRGSYSMARYLENSRPDSRDWQHLSVLDLSCGVGLCGIALSRVCPDVTLTELPENVETVRRNLSVNCTKEDVNESGLPIVVPYAWGARLPPELQRRFSMVLCGDLMYEVFQRRLDAEFFNTLRELAAWQRRQDANGAVEILFCFQVRSTTQESRILSELCNRLNLHAEEIQLNEDAEGFGGLDCCKFEFVPKIRLVCLRG